MNSVLNIINLLTSCHKKRLFLNLFNVQLAIKNSFTNHKHVGVSWYESRPLQSFNSRRFCEHSDADIKREVPPNSFFFFVCLCLLLLQWKSHHRPFNPVLNVEDEDTERKLTISLTYLKPHLISPGVSSIPLLFPVFLEPCFAFCWDFTDLFCTQRVMNNTISWKSKRQWKIW